MSIEIRVEAQRTLDALVKLQKDLRPYINTMMAEIAHKGVEILKASDPQVTAKGQPMPFQSLWTFFNTFGDREDVYTILNIWEKQDILGYFEYGTKPHVILPVTHPYLQFVISENGGEQWIRTKKVHHPGTKKWDMTGKAIEQLDPIIDQYIKLTFAAIDKMMER